MTSSAFRFSLSTARILNIISALKNQALGSFVSKVPMFRGFSEVAEALSAEAAEALSAEGAAALSAEGAAVAALEVSFVIFAGSPV